MSWLKFKPRVRQYEGVAPAAPRTPAPPMPATTMACAPIVKDDCQYSEPYRRLVAARPCVRCRIVGYSQAAHPNVGKAKGAKKDDRECFPLCGTRLLVVGCHYMHDQHQLFARDERNGIEKDWGMVTRAGIIADGTWPEKLPRWGE